MGKYNYSSSRNHIEGLLGYILDVKPYHSKLTEVIEQYYFYDTINVKITDKQFLKTSLSSVWEKSYTTDGLRTRFIIPSYNLPRYSSEREGYSFTIETDQIPYLSTLYNINNAFKLRANTGIESVVVDSQSLAEGLDYFISQGVYSFKTNDPTNSKRFWNPVDLKAYSERYVDGVEIIDPFSFPNYGNLVEYKKGFEQIQFYSLDVNLKSNEFDRWTVDCVENSVSQNVAANTDFVTLQDASLNTYYTVTLNHTLNSQDLLTQFYVLTPSGYESYAPKFVDFIDNNTLQISISDQVQLYASLVSVPSSSILTADFSMMTWHLYHTFRTKESIIQTKLDSHPDNLHLQIRNVNPSQVDISFFYTVSGLNPTLTGKTYVLPTCPSSKFVQPEAASVWTIDATNFGLDFASGIIPQIQVYSEQTLYNQVIDPTSILVADNNIVTITFNSDTTGYVLFSTPGTVNWYSVTSKVKGLLGHGFTNGIFKHPDIGFEILQPSEIGSSVKIGARDSGFTIHPNAPEETWSLIKINPVSYGKPQIGYNGFPTVNIYAAADYIDQNWTVRCTAITVDGDAIFEVVGDDGSYFGPYTVSQTEPTSILVGNVIEMDIFPTVRGFRVGDYYTFILGYDGDEYDLSGLEGSGLEGGPYDLEQLGFDYDEAHINPDFGTLEDFQPMSPGWEILPDPYQGGMYDESINSWSNITFTLQPAADSVKLLPLSAEFTFAPTERWTFTFDSANYRFDVLGSVSGPTEPAYLGREYDNGFIRVRLVNPAELINLKKLNDDTYLHDYTARAMEGGNLTDGLIVYFQILEKRPSYLVVGSTSDNLQPAVVGEYFWNGLIGFKLDLPVIQLLADHTAPVTLAVNEAREFMPNATITALTAPRFDCAPERIDFEFHNDAYLQQTFTNNVRQFLMTSSNRGMLPSSQIGQNYFDIETSITMPENHDLFNFRIDESPLAIPQDAKFSLIVKTHPFQPIHSDGFVLLQPEFATGTLKINTFREDLFNIAINSSHSELGGSGAFIPSYITAANDATAPVINSYIPDRREEYDVWLSNVRNKKIGTISWKLDSQINQYKQVLDFTSEFNSTYLPLNSVVSFSVRQADQYNDLVKVKITENLYFREELIQRELINVHVVEKHNFNIKLTIEETASVLVDLTDQSFGWDTFAWDTDEFDRNGANQILHINLRDQDISGYGTYYYGVIDYDSTLYNTIGGPAQNLPNIAQARITEGLSIAITSPSEDAGYEDVPYDTTGFEILESALQIFKQLDPLKNGPLWPGLYTLYNSEIGLVSATLQMPNPGLTIIVATDLSDIAGSALIPITDYTLELLNTDSANEIYALTINNPVPVIILAYKPE